MTNDEYLSWFTAILEGEGSANTDKKYIQITNSDNEIINECSQILKSNSILHNIYPKKRQFNHHKDQQVIYISTYEVINLINTLGDKFQCRYSEFIDRLKIYISNKREIFLTADLYWLIGIIEAEGSINISLNLHGYYSPRININNTNALIIEKICKSFKAISCKINIQPTKTDNKKEITQIYICDIRILYKFLLITKDKYLSFKYSQRAKYLLEFVKSRIYNYRKPYTAYEHEMYEMIKIIT